MKIARRCVCCLSENLSGSQAVLAPFVAYRVFGWEPAEITADWGLRDIRPGHAYAACATLECADCGALFLDMRFDDEEMAALYAGYRDERYCAARERFEPGYAERNARFAEGSPYMPEIEAFLASHVPAAPRVLDFGGDTGLNTPFRGSAAVHHVHDISGLETVAGAVSVSLAQAGAETYDLIVSSQVLEHVSDPRAMLADIAALARPETKIYLEVPHEDVVRLHGSERPIGPRKRLWHEHVNFFTPESLDAMLAAAGLSRVARQSIPVVAGGREVRVMCVLATRVA